jgi:hypothetical protein
MGFVPVTFAASSALGDDLHLGVFHSSAPMIIAVGEFFRPKIFVNNLPPRTAVISKSSKSA